VRPAYNGTAETDILVVFAGMLRFIQVLYVLIIRTPDHAYCKLLPLNTGFYYAQVPCKTGSTVHAYDTPFPDWTKTFYRIRSVLF